MCIHLINTKGSISRTVLFFCLHLITAWVITFIATGSIETATVVSLAEPIVNAFWYFILDRFVSKRCKHG